MKKSEMVRCEMVQVTPEMAREWLEKNLCAQNDGELRNRKPRANVEDKYHGIMKRSEWNECNGETIKFDTDGNLIDGQHRLRAQIRAGVTLWWLVAYNCRRDAFKTIDDGSTRKGSDMLSIHGEKNVNVLAAVISLVNRYKSGSTRHVTMTNAQVYDAAVAEKEEGIEASVLLAISNRTPKGFVSPSIVAFVHYMGCKGGNEAKATQFLLALCTQESVAGDQPIKILRKRLTENLVASRRANRDMVTAWCVMAWNAFYEGRTLSHAGLRFRTRAVKDESGKVKLAAQEFPRFANF